MQVATVEIYIAGLSTTIDAKINQNYIGMTF